MNLPSGTLLKRSSTQTNTNIFLFLRTRDNNEKKLIQIVDDVQGLGNVWKTRTSTR